jgi:parvulin-like peptidyl-prolyl isomerase
MVERSSVSLPADEIIRFLRKNAQYKEVCHRILYQGIVERTAQDRGVLVTPEEIQREADSFRRQHRLEKSSDTLAWLTTQEMTPDEWELGIRDRLLADKLSEAMFAKEVEKLFAENRLNYDRVSLYQIVFNDDKLAQEIFYQVEEDEISFYEAAHLYDADEQRQARCGYEGIVYRWSLHPAIAAAVFANEPGQITGPIPLDKTHHLVMMEKFLPAELTDELRKELLNQLFQQWLEGELSYVLHNQ